jgi:predicted negative regulator of RcsB-dependent stress response
MPKQIKKKLPKKKAAPETEVKDKLTTFVDNIKNRQRKLATYGLVVLVAILALAGGLIYSYSLKQAAKQLENDAYSIYYNEYQQSQLSDQERYEKALSLFTESYETKKSPRALLYIASCYYELGRYDDALETLKDFTERYSNEHIMVPLAYLKIAQVYQQKGEPDEALKALDAFSHFKSNLYKDYALMESGRILEKEGKLEEAKNKFNEITTRFPNSPFFEEAKAKIEVPEKKDS